METCININSDLKFCKCCDATLYMSQIPYIYRCYTENCFYYVRYSLFENKIEYERFAAIIKNNLYLCDSYHNYDKKNIRFVVWYVENDDKGVKLFKNYKMVNDCTENITPGIDFSYDFIINKIKKMLKVAVLR